MRKFLIRAVSGVVMVWLMLEAVASENLFYYVMWGVVFGASLWELFSIVGKQKFAHKTSWAVGGTLYILLALSLLLMLESQWEMVVVLLSTVWANDVGAYIVGVSIGRHPMAPKISPKKSWEGFFGGLLFAVAVALLWWGLYFEPQMAMGQGMVENRIVWAGLGVVVALGAVGGDLIESRFKRKAQIKDSSKLIPGHGGFLDRFDALFLATPLFYVYCWTLNLI